MRLAYRKTAGITKGSYVRIGDQDLHMTQAELYSVESFKDGVRSDVSVSPQATHEMLDEGRIEAFVRDAKENRPRLSHRDADEVLSLTGAERGGAPTLVSLLEIMRVAENRHSGIPVIRDEMRRAGLRQPVFVETRDTFTARLYNLPEGTTVSSDGTEQLSKEAVIAFCDLPRSRREVADHFGVNVSYVAHAYLNPLADEGVLVRSLPDKPRSKRQRYAAGRDHR